MCFLEKEVHFVVQDFFPVLLLYNTIAIQSYWLWFFSTYTARVLMTNTTLEHYPKEKKASVSSWQHSHEIHTPLANIDPSEQELSEFH